MHYYFNFIVAGCASSLFAFCVFFPKQSFHKVVKDVFNLFYRKWSIKRVFPLHRGNTVIGDRKRFFVKDITMDFTIDISTLSRRTV